MRAALECWKKSRNPKPYAVREFTYAINAASEAKDRKLGRAGGADERRGNPTIRDRSYSARRGTISIKISWRLPSSSGESRAPRAIGRAKRPVSAPTVSANITDISLEKSHSLL
jgi:hypothetical protein